MKRFVMATIVAALMAAAPSWANTQTPGTQSSVVPGKVTQQQAVEAAQIAEQGLYAMRDVQLARLALFHGEPGKAKTLTSEAAALLADDSTDWAKFTKSTKKTNLKNDRYVVINAAMGISENYVATPEKQAAINRANEKLGKGDKKGAVEELRLAGVGVMENLYLMPLKQTQNAVADAQKLLNEQKYYEANLALKGAEEGIIIDSAALFAN